jgi:hypothetical protein
MTGETILFKFLGSNETFTQEQVKNIIRKDPNALFIAYRLKGEPYYGILGSEELYTLEEIRQVLDRDKLALLAVYQSNRGSPNRQNGHVPPMCRVGNMNGETALQKFG